MYVCMYIYIYIYIHTHMILCYIIVYYISLEGAKGVPRNGGREQQQV